MLILRFQERKMGLAQANGADCEDGTSSAATQHTRKDPADKPSGQDSGTVEARDREVPGE